MAELPRPARGLYSQREQKPAAPVVGNGGTMRKVALCVALMSAAVGCATSLESSLPYQHTVERVRLMCKRLSAEDQEAYRVAGVRETPLYPGTQMAFTFTEPAAADTETRIHLEERGDTTTVTVSCERDAGTKNARDTAREGIWRQIVGHYVTNDPPGGPSLVELITKLRKTKPR